MENMRSTSKLLSEKLKRGIVEDGGIDGRIILKWIVDKQGVKIWIGFVYFRTMTI
jgi:hypothetical protein